MFVYISHIVLFFILVAIISIISEEGGYVFILPLWLIVFLLALILFMINIESFFFKFYGIRWSKSDSEKFLMAKDYIKRAIVIIVAAGIILAWNFILIPMADEGMDSTEKLTIYGNYNTTFWSQDAFGATGVRSISVTSEDDVLLDIFIMQEDDFLAGHYGKRLNLDEDESRGLTELNYESENLLPRDDYILFLDAQNQTTEVSYTIYREVSQSFLWYLTIFSLLFIVANAVWIVYLLPIKKKYEKTSIYE